jgi:hypothetical protein
MSNYALSGSMIRDSDVLGPPDHGSGLSEMLYLFLKRSTSHLTV